MRQLKKSPRKQLEKFSTVFMQLGLVLTLFVVYVVIEHETLEKKLLVDNNIPIDNTFVFDLDQPITFVKEPVKIPEVKLPEPKVDPILTKIDKLDNDNTFETVLSKQKKIEPKIVDLGSLPDDTPEVIDAGDDPLPMILVDEIPVYRGCEGLNPERTKECFTRKITKHVQKHFNSSLSEDLGLRTGRHKMYTSFVIDKTGKIVDVTVKAPHPRLKKEAQRIVDKVPLFTPGKQQGKPVKVKYTLPITFYVE